MRHVFRTFTWNVYQGDEDTDDPVTFLGTIEAFMEGEARREAEEKFQHPAYDLVVKRADLDRRTAS